MKFFIEFVVIILIVYGFYHEDKFILAEEKIKKAIKMLLK